MLSGAQRLGKARMRRPTGLAILGGIEAMWIRRAISSGCRVGFVSMQPLVIMRAASASVRPVRLNSASMTSVGAPRFIGADGADVYSFSDVYLLFLNSGAKFGALKVAETASNFGALQLEIGAPNFGAPIIISSSS